MNDPISDLKELLSRASAKAETIPALVREVNRVLAEINPVMPVWLEDDPLETGDVEEDERKDGSVRRWRRATLLGFCSMQDGWQLSVRDAVLEEVVEDAGNIREFLRELTAPAPLTTADGELQTRAVFLLSDLVQLLRTKAERFLDAIERTERLVQKARPLHPRGTAYVE